MTSAILFGVINALLFKLDNAYCEIFNNRNSDASKIAKELA